jgi:hypothetical protein
MAINTFSPKQQGYGTFFSYSTGFVEVRTDIEVLANPGNNLSYYITDLVLCPGTSAASFEFTTAKTGTSAYVIDPIYLAANVMQSVGFKTPVFVGTGASLRISSDKPIGGTRTVIISGYKL